MLYSALLLNGTDISTTIYIYILYAQKLNTLSHGQYSQVHKMRTLASVFRATSLELLKSLSVGGNSGNTHFVRCIRGDLEFAPRGFKVHTFFSTNHMLVIFRKIGFGENVARLYRASWRFSIDVHRSC